MGVTARSTIQGALQLIGVQDPNETMSAEDSDTGLTFLNNMVDAWNLERLNLYATTNVIATFSGISATIGPGMTIDTARPIRIESAFYRRSSIDYPLEIITEPEYNRIGMKNISGDYPEVMYYDAGSPTGNVYVFPVPASNEYHIQVLTQITEFVDLDTLYDLPQGYAKALMYALAVELAPLYQKEPSASVVRQHLNSKRNLKRANVEVPLLETHLADNSSGPGRINILSNR